MRILSLVIAVAVISGCASAPQRSDQEIYSWALHYAREEGMAKGDYSGIYIPVSKKETLRRLAEQDKAKADRQREIIAAAIIGGAISGTLRGIDNRHRYRPRRLPAPPRPPRPPR